MPKVTYITPDGASVTIDGKEGATVMETAIQNGVAGIIAECGGSCACATCHVFVESAPTDIAAARGGDEEDMLEFANDEMQPNSRLSCQIKLTPELDGLVVRVAQND